MKLLIFSLLFSSSVFAWGENYKEDMQSCVLLSNEPTVCDMMGCKMIDVINSQGEHDQLCISVDRVKWCASRSSTQHTCQRGGCFYDFARNFCYPHILRLVEVVRPVVIQPLPAPVR